MELYKKLKKLRKENGITQEELAKNIKVSIQTINKWENNKSLPDAINLLNLSKYYKISLDELMNTKTTKYKAIKNKLTPYNYLQILFKHIFKQNIQRILKFKE